MKKFLLLLSCYLISDNIKAQGGGVGIGTNNPHSSAVLDLQSTEKGVLVPRMTSVQRNAISNAATGLLVFDNTTGTFWFKAQNGWSELIDTSASNLWKKTGVADNIRYNSGNVGIGSEDPEYHLHINKPNSSIGFTDSETGELSGFISGNSKDLTVGGSRALFGSGTTPGNLLLQTSAGFAVAGNVGIGKTDPLRKLTINGDVGLYKGNDVLATLDSVGDHFLINSRLGSIGLEPKHIVMQYENDLVRVAGNVGIGNNNPTNKLDVAGTFRATGNITGSQNINATGNVQLGGELNHSTTGANNMMAVAYGRIAADGTIETGSGNFTVSKGVTGFYNVQVDGITNANATIVAAIYGTDTQLRSALVHTMFGQFGIETLRFRAIAEAEHGYLVHIVSERIDSAFTFVVFRQ
jgi:hypothetical protein